MGWILAILAGGFLTFNAVVTPDKAADEAAKALRAKFPGAQVKVNIEGKRGKAVLNGRFKRVDVEMSDFRLDDALVDQMTAPTPAPLTPLSTTPVPLPVVPATQASALKVPVQPARPAPKIKIGRADEINIALSHFHWDALPVERAEFHLKNTQYDWDALKGHSQFVLIKTDDARMHLELAPEALTPLVEKRVPNVNNARVSIVGEKLSVHGERQFYGLNAPFEVKGNLGFSGPQVIMQAPTLLVSGLPIPAPLAAPLLKSINPLYSVADLKDLPFAVELKNVWVRDGKLQIDAALKMKR